MNGRCTVVVSLFGLFTCTAAYGQAPPPVHKADALFNAGRDLLDAGEYAEACPKFAEANTIAPGLGVTLYLADCYERLGKTSSALFWFRRAVEMAAVKKDKRGPVAAARAAALVARVPSLTVKVTPEALQQHVEVKEDGTPLPATAWGVSKPIDPGDHVLEVSATGKVTRRLTMHLVPRAEAHVETVLPLDEPPPPAPAAVVAEVVPVAPVALPPPEQGAPRARGDKTLLTVAIVTTAVGVVGLGVGAALGVVASSKLSDSNDGPCDATNHCTAQGLSLRSDAEHVGNASTVAFVVGGAAVAAGVVVFLVRPRAGASSSSASVSPFALPGGGGLNLGGAF